MTIDIDALLAKQQAYLESIEPVEVPVMVGEVLLTVRVPFIMPNVFNDLADRHPSRPGVRLG